MDLCVRSVFQWSPPLYFRGPFLFFLQKHPDAALTLIIKLVNFTVDRLVEGWQQRGEEIHYVHVKTAEREQTWVADRRVYGWFRQYNLAPMSVVVALMALEKWLYDELDVGRDVDSTIARIFDSSNNVAFAGLLLTVGKKSPPLLFRSLRPLVEVPEFYEWDCQITVAGNDHLMLGWTMFPHAAPLVKIASEFHSLPHKRILLPDLVASMIVNGAISNEIRKEIRENWERRMAPLPGDDPLRVALENLTARFDPANYKIENDSKERQLWRFTPPEHLQRRWDVNQEDLDRRKLLLKFPLLCEQLLESRTPVAADRMLDFWDQIERLAKMDRPADEEPGTIEPADGVCGGIAVLVCLHREWLRQAPDKEAWCLKYLEDTIANPPPLDPIGAEESEHTWGWDHFAARTLPSIWAENPSDEWVRRSVAKLAFAHHYNAVSFLMTSALAVRDMLGDDFARLEHLVLQSASIRWNCDRLADPREARRQREALAAPLIDAFVNGTLSRDMPSWQEFETTVRPGPPSLLKERKPPRRELGLDLEFIPYAFDWIPSVEDARDDEERTRWLGFWREALDRCIAMVKKSLGKHGTPNRTPYKFDHWIMRRVASLMPELPATEARSFWLPVLELGLQGHYWVEDFLRNWFALELDREEPRRSFISTWKEMLGFARSTKSWDSRDRLYYDLETLWCTIMGFNSLNVTQWRQNHASVVADMTEEYKAWAEGHLAGPNCCVHFAGFLKQRAADPLLDSGLEWIETMIRSDRGRNLLKDTKVLEALAELLDHVWRRRRARVGSSSKTRRSFDAILARLAEEAQPIALELQVEVARSPGS